MGVFGSLQLSIHHGPVSFFLCAKRHLHPRRVADHIRGSGRGWRDDHALQRMVCAVLNARAALCRNGPRRLRRDHGDVGTLRGCQHHSDCQSFSSWPTSKVSPRSNSSLKLQVSNHSRLLTMASQRRYNQPNIAMGVTAVYANKISLAFHERRCGVATSSDKTDGQEPSEDGTKGQGPWLSLSFAADLAGSSENLWCASALRRIADLPSASSCLIWLIIAPVSVCTLWKWGCLP